MAELTFISDLVPHKIIAFIKDSAGCCHQTLLKGLFCLISPFVFLFFFIHHQTKRRKRKRRKELIRGKCRRADPCPPRLRCRLGAPRGSRHGTSQLRGAGADPCSAARGAHHEEEDYGLLRTRLVCLSFCFNSFIKRTLPKHC